MPRPAEVTLPSDREVRVTRTFNAPRQLVWDAHTKPELVPKWQGYDDWDMPVCEMDVRVGGRYRWKWKNRADGTQFGFFGTFTEVDAPSRIVHEQYYDPRDVDLPMAVGDPSLVSPDRRALGVVTAFGSGQSSASRHPRRGAVPAGGTDGLEGRDLLPDSRIP